MPFIDLSTLTLNQGSFKRTKSSTDTDHADVSLNGAVKMSSRQNSWKRGLWWV